MRKTLKKHSVIIILCTILLSAFKNETGITGSVVPGISPGEFILYYNVTNNHADDTSSGTPLVIPLEKHIIQGNIQAGVITEKDTLFSQTDIDLNGDNDCNDSYPAKIIKNEVFINGTKLSPLIRKSQNYTVMFPYDHGNYNLNKISDKGMPFTLRDFTATPPVLTIGITPEKKIEFINHQNSMLLIEIIIQNRPSVPVLIEGSETSEGTTNEKEITGGEKHIRFFAVKNVPVSKGSGKGNVIIKNAEKPFNVRLTYFFSIPGTFVLMNQKVIEVK